ncbi:MAG: 23S rRNA pseudouridine1911/1915/1917 synthase [Candidatus Krumholzibacteriia bacterium]|jgi:23S rRNA pseudouridine1911/1915/1917 synthase
MSISVIYEDNHLLVLDKPAGLLAQGDHSGAETVVDVAAAYLKQKYSKPGNVYVGLVHRLDRNVSGVMVIARTSKAAARLSEQFRTKAVAKIYHAVVVGTPVKPEMEIVSWLSSSGDHQGITRAEATVFSGAKESRLRYTVTNSGNGFSQLQVEPSTGRRHQIRAQLALVGHPLLGDVKYGSDWRLPGRRLALHAQSLELKHPIGGRTLVFKAPVPSDWPWPNPVQKARRK